MLGWCETAEIPPTVVSRHLLPCYLWPRCLRLLPSNNLLEGSKEVPTFILLASMTCAAKKTERLWNILPYGSISDFKVFGTVACLVELVCFN